jgi:large subunit ribosomal protein L30
MSTKAPKITITLKKGYLHEKHRIKECIRVLGLRKIGQTVVRPDSPALRGLIRKSHHLLNVERPSS